MSLKTTKLIFSIAAILFANSVIAQDDLLSMVNNGEKPKEYINNAFKSSRVVNGHSIEFIGKGVLDVRILHRFGLINQGAGQFFGLDQASMRMGFDYGVTKDLTVGVGRSTIDKEIDGFLKYRLIQQSVGGKHPSPVSVVAVTGATMYTTPWVNPNVKYYFTSRLGYYNELIIGRKFNENFSLQIAPTHVHLNLVPYDIYANNIFAVGFGGRYKLSKRTAFVVDYHYILRQLDTEKTGQFDNLKNPLSVGFDIETGGHVFQLHFSNSTGMNEKAFITNTTNSWGKGEIRFGFNLSRVFTVAKK